MVLHTLKRNGHAKYLVSVLLSIFLVFATLYLPKTINTTQDIKGLNNIACGWPLSFVIFDSASNPPPIWTVSCIGWSGSPMDTQKHILWLPFLVNVSLVGTIIWVFIFLITKVTKRTRKLQHIQKENKPEDKS